MLEPRLGNVASERCIRIPATLNVFLDVHGILDADHEAAAAHGEKPWILSPHRQTISWPGRFMVIVDSQVAERPAWSPLPTAAGGKSPSAPAVTRCEVFARWAGPDNAGWAVV